MKPYIIAILMVILPLITCMILNELVLHLPYQQAMNGVILGLILSGIAREYQRK